MSGSSEGGPVPGVCPYVLTSSSSVDEGPVPLVVSPSLPAAVDLSVCHVDELPLNLSVSTVSQQRAAPPPAHRHFTLTRPDTPWTQPGDPAVSAGDVHSDDALRSLDVLSAAAALRAETIVDQRLVPPAATTAATDSVTLSSLVDICRQVRHCTAAKPCD